MTEPEGVVCLPMFNLKLDWDRPAKLNNEPTVHVLRACLTPQIGATKDRLPLHLAIALDTSASMEGEKLDYAITACKAAMTQLAVTDRFSMACFSGQIEPLFENLSGQETERASQALSQLIADGATCTDQPLDWFQRVFTAQSGGIQVAILITDGQATDTRGKLLTDLVPLLNQATNLAQGGAVLYSVGYGNPLYFNPAFLIDLSHHGSGDFIYADTPDALQSKLQETLAFYQKELVESVRFRLVLSSGATLSTMVHVKNGGGKSTTYLPLEADSNGEVTIKHLPTNQDTNILMEIRIPMLDFGEPLARELIATVHLMFESESFITARESIEYTSSYKRSQTVNQDVNIARLKWYTNRYSIECVSNQDPQQATQLLADLRTAALQLGNLELAEQAAKNSQYIQQTGRIDVSSATGLLQDCQRLDGTK